MPASSTTPPPDPVALDLARRLRARLGSHLLRLVLFGSRARGDAREGSDYDVLVVVDERTEELRELLLDVTGDLLDERDALALCLLLSADEWEDTRVLPIGRNIEREGLVL